ncbi:RepB family plasmid replication initiator protein (plasmid) [Paenibacillus sonchi]|uniref:RepB family plasmid replication initiator protein n=1 Tax=Paenibacillus sonchi TaxID=373687 RepID=A0A974PIP8_9BACL|nr:plasmid replication initiator TrfA [Paenibacillus sonchi]QQZ64576.1 RepB family plasmid replication initiator protein [Paenibacillus sonchi]
MPPRKSNIETWITKIISLGLPKDDVTVQTLINDAAEELKGKSKIEAQRHIREEGQKELELHKIIASQKLSDSELNEINTQIFKHEVRQIIWQKSQELRRAAYYSKPSHPYGDIFSTGAISSISKSRNKSSEIADDGETLVRDNRRTKIYHPAKKELTLQDAKVLIGIHKLWEESGKEKEFEFTIFSLAKAIGRDTGGKTYKEIWESLEVLQDSKFEFTYYYKQGLIESLDRINILQSIGRRDRQKTFKIMFSDAVYRSLQAGAFAYLSLAILEDLNTSTAQNLYLFLPAQVAQGNRRWSLEEIVTLMGAKANRPQKRKDIVKEACENMVELNLLEGYEFHTDETGTVYCEFKPSRLLLMSSNTINTTRNENIVEQLTLL